MHKNTIRQWQRGGLKPIDASRPVLFHGGTVRAFLKERDVGRKRPCGLGRFYCFRYRKPRVRAPAGMVNYLALTTRARNLRALCGTCGALMHRRALLSTIAVVMPGMAVQIVQAR